MPTPTSADLRDELAVTVEDGVATLWLNRPDKRNAVTLAMWRALAEHCRRLATDARVRVLVVRGVGDHFCAGADIADLAAVDLAEYHQVNTDADAALAAFPKPTVAVVTGACVGGGTEIATACDLRFADATARVGITPARLGIVYPAIAVERVVRLAGPSATKHLLYSAEIVDAERALRVGLLDEVHPVGTLDARVEAFTTVLARERSLLTQMASKQLVDAASAHGRIDPNLAARWSAEAAEGTDAAEGMAAFLERRSPVFTWAPGGEKPLGPSQPAGS
ncbi:MAG: enoyl-CoA hydratase/isomerase family protein [Acidimicrobiales bacterium]